jgi:hypothetical protein
MILLLRMVFGIVALVLTYNIFRRLRSGHEKPSLNDLLQFLGIVVSILVATFANPIAQTLQATAEAPTPIATFTYAPEVIVAPTATLTSLPTDKPAESPTTSLAPTPTATVQSTVEPSWCDNFDDGRIDESRWNLPTDPTLIYEENGVLNFRVVDDAWAGLEAKLTNETIVDIRFTITLISYEENIPGGTGIDVFLKEAEPVFSVDIGPGPNGPGGEFSFCPDFNAEYDECQHPTPVPNRGAFNVVVGKPIGIHVTGSGHDIIFDIDNQPLASAPVTAPIENFQFFIYADPDAALQATIDNVCVTYEGN